MATTNDTRKPMGILTPDGRNYLAWAARVKTNTRKEGVYKHLLPPDDGGIARPPAAGNAQTKWDEDDGDALQQIYKLLDDQGVARVSALDTAHEVWTFLKKKYQNTGEAEMQQARTTLGNTRFKYNNKVTDLIDTVNELFAVFDGSGAPLHENENSNEWSGGRGSVKRPVKKEHRGSFVTCKRLLPWRGAAVFEKQCFQLDFRCMRSELTNNQIKISQPCIMQTIKL
jgi:hypothetical protein